jgi:hypothetical protein
MSGGGGEQSTEVKINSQLAEGGRNLQNASQDLFNEGTSGIYQDTRLADFDPRIAQGEQSLLDLYGGGGTAQGTVDAQTASLQQLLGAGDYDNPFLREQIESLTGSATDDFLRNIAPRLDQGASQAGQFGSSRAGIAEGVAIGDTQDAIAQSTIQALLGGQQIALGANQLLPSALASQERGGQLTSQIGSQATMRDQARLLDEIALFEQPRTNEQRRQSEFAQAMNLNPLIGAQSSVSQVPGADPWSQALGLAATAAGTYFGGPAGGVAAGTLTNAAIDEYLGGESYSFT